MKITDGTAEFEIKELDRLTITGIEGKTDLHSALHRYGDNPTDLKGLTNEQWYDKGTFISYFSKPDLIENQPSTYGQLINLIPTNDESIEDYNHDVCQIWVQQVSGDIWTRGGNKSNPLKDTSFNKCVMLKKQKIGTEGYRLYSDGLLEYWTVAKIPQRINYPFPLQDWENNIQYTLLVDSQATPHFTRREKTGCNVTAIGVTRGYGYIYVRGYIEQ